MDTAVPRHYQHINRKDSNGNTPLLRSLKRRRSDEYIIRLLINNANPNVFDRSGHSPLFYAIERRTLAVAYALLEKGANVNYRKPTGMTALSRIPISQDYCNLQAICLLLYYGADPNVKFNSYTPFLEALNAKNVRASEILLRYYDGGLRNVLYHAIPCDTNLSVRLIEMGANVNYVSQFQEHLLQVTLRNVNVTLFKLIWERFDYSIILNWGVPFLDYFFMYCGEITNNDWLECLNLVLTSSVGFELVQQSNGAFFTAFFEHCKKSNVGLSDRLRIIHLVSSLSMHVSFEDLRIAYKHFGFNDELETLIYFLNCDDKMWYTYEEKHYLMPLFLGMDDDFYEMEFSWRDDEILEHGSLGYFNRSLYNDYGVESDKLSEKVQLLPNFPSLLELCRKTIRKCIRKAIDVEQPYEFHDAVKSLKLPQLVEDIIRFKTPIYH